MKLLKYSGKSQARWCAVQAELIGKLGRSGSGMVKILNVFSVDCLIHNREVDLLTSLELNDQYVMFLCIGVFPCRLFHPKYIC